MGSKKINIAIDGFSGCGKSTLAKALAHHYHYIYIDSGAMYRAMTWYFLHHQIAPENLEMIAEHLNTIQLDFKKVDQQNILFLNETPLIDEIRSMEVNENVSQYAVISIIRKKLVELQRCIADAKGVVMDGRDIGTVVMPDAEVKLFITCDIDVRTMRRKKELDDKQIFSTFESIRSNLLERDRIDTTRKDSPLQKADDATLIDNTHLTEAEQLQLAINLIDDVVNT